MTTPVSGVQGGLQPPIPEGSSSEITTSPLQSYHNLPAKILSYGQLKAEADQQDGFSSREAASAPIPSKTPKPGFFQKLLKAFAITALVTLVTRFFASKPSNAVSSETQKRPAEKPINLEALIQRSPESPIPEAELTKSSRESVMRAINKALPEQEFLFENIAEN